MEIVTIDSSVARKENPYVADIAELIKATNAYTGPSGKSPAGVFTVPTKDVQKTVFYIQQTAISQGVTARIASKQTNGVNSKGSPTRIPVPETKDGKLTGNTVLIFKIAPKRKDNGRKPRSTSTVKATNK